MSSFAGAGSSTPQPSPDTARAASDGNPGVRLRTAFCGSLKRTQNPNSSREEELTLKYLQSSVTYNEVATKKMEEDLGMMKTKRIKLEKETQKIDLERTKIEKEMKKIDLETVLLELQLQTIGSEKA